MSLESEGLTQARELLVNIPSVTRILPEWPFIPRKQNGHREASVPLTPYALGLAQQKQDYGKELSVRRRYATGTAADRVFGAWSLEVHQFVSEWENLERRHEKPSATAKRETPCNSSPDLQSHITDNASSPLAAFVNKPIRDFPMLGILKDMDNQIVPPESFYCSLCGRRPAPNGYPNWLYEVGLDNDHYTPKYLYCLQCKNFDAYCNMKSFASLDGMVKDIKILCDAEAEAKAAAQPNWIVYLEMAKFLRYKYMLELEIAARDARKIKELKEKELDEWATEQKTESAANVDDDLRVTPFNMSYFGATAAEAISERITKQQHSAAQITQDVTGISLNDSNVVAGYSNYNAGQQNFLPTYPHFQIPQTFKSEFDPSQFYDYIQSSGTHGLSREDNVQMLQPTQDTTQYSPSTTWLAMQGGAQVQGFTAAGGYYPYVASCGSQMRAQPGGVSDPIVSQGTGALPDFVPLHTQLPQKTSSLPESSANMVMGMGMADMATAARVAESQQQQQYQQYFQYQQLQQFHPQFSQPREQSSLHGYEDTDTDYDLYRNKNEDDGDDDPTPSSSEGTIQNNANSLPASMSPSPPSQQLQRSLRIHSTEQQLKILKMQFAVKDRQKMEFDARLGVRFDRALLRDPSLRSRIGIRMRRVEKLPLILEEGATYIDGVGIRGSKWSEGDEEGIVI
ncbi:hypothetical protein BDZ91DRAFT_763691 [Kalaharituber pfeilii]|nr:hypothetical protein BDZ91DRAFT_763691 [Kalaharituber pfeilii]